MYYSIHNYPNDKELKRGWEYSCACLADGDDRHDVIEEAENYLCDKAYEDMDYGDGEKDVLLVIMDDNDNEVIERIKLTWFADEDEVLMRHELSSPYWTGRA